MPDNWEVEAAKLTAKLDANIKALDDHKTAIQWILGIILTIMVGLMVGSFRLRNDAMAGAEKAAVTRVASIEAKLDEGLREAEENEQASAARVQVLEQQHRVLWDGLRTLNDGQRHVYEVMLNVARESKNPGVQAIVQHAPPLPAALTGPSMLPMPTPGKSPRAPIQPLPRLQP